MLIAIQLALESEGMGLVYVWRKTPGELKAVGLIFTLCSFIFQWYILHIYLDLLSRKVLGGYVGLVFFSLVSSWFYKPFTLKNFVYACYRDIDLVLVPEHKPDMVRSTVCSSAYLKNQPYYFRTVGFWTGIGPAGVGHESVEAGFTPLTGATRKI